MSEGPLPSDGQQIRNVVTTWIEATRNGDLDTVLSLMTDDVVFLVPGREPMRKTEFAALSRVEPGQPRPRIDGTSEIQELVITGDWAYAWSKLRVEVFSPDGTPQMIRAGHTLTVFKKEQGKWLLARDANLLAPVPTAK